MSGHFCVIQFQRQEKNTENQDSLKLCPDNLKFCAKTLNKNGSEATLPANKYQSRYILRI